MQETGKRRKLVDMPWGFASMHAALHEGSPLPRPLITRDQVELLKTDSIVRDPQAKNLHDLGITPTALELILPTYLGRFRGGELRKAAA